MFIAILRVWMFVSQPNFYVDIETPKELVLEGGVLWDMIRCVGTAFLIGIWAFTKDSPKT
jgi:hypothetical protein